MNLERALRSIEKEEKRVALTAVQKHKQREGGFEGGQKDYISPKRRGGGAFGQLTFFFLQLDIDLTGQPAVSDTFSPFPQECVKYFRYKRRIRGMKDSVKPIVAACERRLSGGRRYPFDGHDSAGGVELS